MKLLKKDSTVKVSLSVPKTVLEEIDNLCSARFVTRTYWFIQAALEKLESDRFEKSKAIMKRIEQLESR